MAYKKITVRFGQNEFQEDQIYVVEDGVTEEQILKGDDTGVVCLCIADLADTLVECLNQKIAA
ncbi:hypothetical protein ABE527_02620 [Brucella sp. TWI432]